MILPKKNYAVLALIIVFGIVMRALHWSPSPDGDEARYINHAVALAQWGTPRYFDGAIAVRLPYLLFLSSWGCLFGFGTTNLQASGLFLYGILAVLLYQLGEKLYDWRVGLMSVFLFSLFPIHVLLSTHCLSDDLALVFALGATLAWIHSWTLPGWKPQAVAWFLAGLAAGLATGVRQPFFLLGVILPTAALTQGQRWTRVIVATIIFAMGALFYVILESLAFSAWLGDPLFRVFHDVLQSDAGRSTVEAVVPAMASRPQSVIEKLFYFRGYMGRLQPSGSFGLFPLLWVLATIDRITKQDRRSVTILIFCVVLLVYHFWGTTSLVSWSVPPVNPRYLIPIFAVGTVGAAALLVALHESYVFTRPLIVSAALAWTVLSLWICAYGSRPSCTAEFIQHLDALCRENRQTVVVPESTVRYFLPHDYWHYLDGMKIIPDFEIAMIEKLDLRDVRIIAVPNESFYSYKHIGVNDALERTASWWRRSEVVGEKWPRYLKLTGKPSTRVIGYLYILQKKGDN